MNVRLISYSQPADTISVDNAQDLIAYCARVSNPTNQLNNSTSEKLIRYLIKHGHWSPLEMVSACLEIETTRDIAHQIVRHRSFSFQEFSQRYAKPTAMGSIYVSREARLQDNKNRQNSIDNVDQETVVKWNSKIREHFAKAKGLYDGMIKDGIAKECARFILPLATPTRIYMSGSIRSWIHYIDLRSANGTQKEHMDIALSCKDIFKNQFPVISVALGWAEDDK